MHVRSPHCHSPIDIVDNSSLTIIDFPSCGSHFSLVGDSDATTTPPSGARRLAHFKLVRQLGVDAFGSDENCKGNPPSLGKRLELCTQP